MTNIEKFDQLKAENLRLTDRLELYEKQIHALEDLFRSHAHAPSGDVMVKYSRSTAY